MLLILRSTVLVLAAISSVCFASTDVATSATKASPTENAQVSKATAQVSNASEQKQKTAQAEVKLDDKPAPLYPAEAKTAANDANTNSKAKVEVIVKGKDEKETKADATEKAKTSSAPTVVKVEANVSVDAKKNEAVKPAAQNDKAATGKEEEPSKQNASATAEVNTATSTTTDAANNTADLSVVEFVLANQIESREPKEVVESFAENADRGFAFARLSSKTTTEVTFLWTRNGQEFARITSPIHAAKKWRTFSSVKLRPGEWKVQLLDQNKVVLAEKSFIIK